MIQVPLAWLVFVLLGLFLAGIFGAWLLFEARRQRRERLAFEHVYRCSACGCEFEDATAADLAACPRCGAQNERERPSRL